MYLISSNFPIEILQSIFPGHFPIFPGLLTEMHQPLGVSERRASSNSFSPPTARRKAALASAQLLDLAMGGPMGG